MFRLVRLYLILAFSGAALGWPGSIQAQTSMPTPPASAHRLFYVQRTSNTNTIVYDANLTGGRKFVSKQPINVYWIRYAEDGRVEPLSYIQRTLAYGVEVRPGGKPEEYEFNVVSYAKRKLRLTIDASGQPHAIVDINGKKAWLNRVYIKIEGKKAGIIPEVKYVELFGSDPQTAVAVYERFVP